ncbi:MAG: preprotein translocase subunit SecA, partial [Spirochaetales bacterium]|nr:preprotein translocase subunit SecA [Spirochaetales bacterium]
MARSFLSTLFGTKQEKDLKHLYPIVQQVNDLESWAQGLADDQFPDETQKLKDALRQGATLDDLVPKAFALAREAAFRVLGERHYDVQIMGAMVLH